MRISVAQNRSFKYNRTSTFDTIILLSNHFTGTGNETTILVVLCVFYIKLRGVLANRQTYITPRNDACALLWFI